MHGGYRENAGRKHGSKSVVRKEILELYNKYREEVHNRYDTLLENLFDLALNSDNDAVRLKATMYVFDRLLGRPTQSIQITDMDNDKTLRDVLTAADLFNDKKEPTIVLDTSHSNAVQGAEGEGI